MRKTCGGIHFLVKTLKDTLEEVHFSVKSQAAGFEFHQNMNPPQDFQKCFSKIQEHSLFVKLM